VWPAKDDGLSQIVSDEIIAELMAFAIHARRYMELTGNKELSADGPLLKIQLPDYRYEKNIWTIVNRLVHSSEVQVHSVTADPIKHDHLGDLVIAVATVTSPQRDTVAICPQGMFYGFAQSPLADAATR
jgi:hypothetical protein